ncbi:MAG: hypothetical protein Q4B69_02445 [Slackia sp.]|nr:hypothetical protein [Slackia sp.]
METDRKKGLSPAKTALSATMAAALTFGMTPMPSHRALAEEAPGGGYRIRGV